MVQFYIASGTVIASLILQLVLFRNIDLVDNKLSEKEEKRILTENSAKMAITYIKWVCFVEAAMLIWSFVLIFIYKELLVSMLVLAMQLVFMVLFALMNNKVGTIAAVSETQILHIFKMDYNYTQEMVEQLVSINNLKLMGAGLIVFANTIGLYLTLALFNDNILIVVVNFLLAVMGYSLVLKSMRKRQSIVFSNQLGVLTKEKLDEYTKEAIQEFTVGAKDFIKEKKLNEDNDTRVSEDGKSFTYVEDNIEE